MTILVISLGVLAAVAMAVLFTAAAKAGKAVTRAYIGAAKDVMQSGMYFRSR